MAMTTEVAQLARRYHFGTIVPDKPRLDWWVGNGAAAPRGMGWPASWPLTG